MKNPNAGFLLLLLKLGPKLFPLIKSLGDELLIFAKTLLGIGTAGTAAVSAGFYAYLFTWETGVGLIAFLIMHEYGHVWGMRKSGVATKGMYFIPFMGAVAIMDKLVHSARNEAFISIMGPVFGFLLFVLPGYLVWQYTGSEAVAALTSLCCFVNLINLLPIMPLDGGRMLKSIGYSENVVGSLLLIVGISAVTTVVALYVGFTLFALMATIGFLEICLAFGIHEHLKRALRTLFRIAYCYLIVTLMPEQSMAADGSVGYPDVPWWLIMLFTFIIVGMIGLLIADIFRLKKTGESFVWTILFYPSRVVGEAVGGVQDLFALRGEHVKPIEQYVPMPGQAKFLYVLITVTLVVMHFVVMFHLSGTSTGSLFTDMLK